MGRERDSKGGPGLVGTRRVGARTWGWNKALLDMELEEGQHGLVVRASDAHASVVFSQAEVGPAPQDSDQGRGAGGKGGG